MKDWNKILKCPWKFYLNICCRIVRRFIDTKDLTSVVVSGMDKNRSVKVSVKKTMDRNETTPNKKNIHISRWTNRGNEKNYRELKGSWIFKAWNNACMYIDILFTRSHSYKQKCHKVAELVKTCSAFTFVAIFVCFTTWEMIAYTQLQWIHAGYFESTTKYFCAHF